MKVTKEMVQFGLFIIFAFILYSIYLTFFTTTVKARDAIQTEKPTHNLRSYEGMEDHEGFISLKNMAKKVGGAAKTVGKGAWKGTKAVAKGAYKVGKFTGGIMKEVGGSLLTPEGLIEVGSEFL